MQINQIPKLAFFDIDGTLLGSSGKLSRRTKEALFELRKTGTHLALATGRPLFGARPIAEELEINCYSLFSSGALLANPGDNEILFEAMIPDAECITCIELAKKHGLYIELYSKDSYYIEHETDLTKKHTEYLGLSPVVADFESIVGKLPINKIVTISDNSKLDLAQEVLSRELNKLVCLCSKGASHPEIMFNNITSPAANRVDSFKRIIKKLEISAEEVIAFGDASSDLSFIELAGTGVAMAEAPAEVKAKAQIIAESAEMDGVAKVIEEMLGNK